MARLAHRNSPACPVRGIALLGLSDGSRHAHQPGTAGAFVTTVATLAGIQCNLGTAVTYASKEEPHISTELGRTRVHSRWRPSMKIWGSWSSSIRIVRVDRPPNDPRRHFTSTPDYRALATGRGPTLYAMIRALKNLDPPPQRRALAPNACKSGTFRRSTTELNACCARICHRRRRRISTALRARLHACKHASDGLSDDLQQAESSGRTESTFRACRSQSFHRPAATALTT
jgi:hypothetical protein